jgi:glucokinase
VTPVPAILAIDVGGTTIKAEVASGDAILASGRCPTPKGDQALAAVRDLGATLIAQAATTGAGVQAAGVVVPGIVDAAQGIAVYSANIGWDRLAVTGPLATEWGIPVRLGHDVIAAGQAEYLTGAGQGATDVAFVAIGTGIAAALIVGGRVLDGNGTAQPGEIGHVVVRPGGPECGCGNRGCLEAVASAAAIARAYERATGEPAAGGALAVFRAAQSDPRARVVIEAATVALADGLALLTTLLAPQRIVLGGGLAEAGAALLDPVAKALASRVHVQPSPVLVTARHGERAGIAGAALLARSVLP